MLLKTPARAFFDKHGYLPAFRVLPEGQEGGFWLEYHKNFGGEKVEKTVGRHKDVACIKLLTHDPKIRSMVRQLIGRHRLLTTGIFEKNYRTDDFVSWHQDQEFWTRTHGKKVVTIWFAVRKSTRENGCLKVLAGSHKKRLPHVLASEKAGNMLHRGQYIPDEHIGQANVVYLEVPQGFASAHHGMTAHASEANKSDDSRIGIALRFVSYPLREQIVDKIRSLWK